MVEYPVETCIKCKSRPIASGRSTKYCVWCLETRNKADRKYDLAHRKENYERTKRWNRLHPEKLKEYYEKAKTKVERVVAKKLYSAEYKKSDRGKLSSKRYSEKHKEVRKSYNCKYAEKNKDKIQARQLAWQKANPEKVKATTKKYRDMHPEYVTRTSRQRREIFKNIEGTFTKKEWVSLCEKFGNKCLWCGEEKKLTIDHVVPVSKLGRGDISNLQPLCKSCNSRKRARILDFRPFGSAIMEWT